MAWYDQLITDIKAGFSSVSADVKAVLPRLLPSGGNDGQVLTKSGSTNYVAGWVTPTSGGNPPLVAQDSINTFLQATDRLIDMGTSSGLSNRQGYFQQIIAERNHSVGGISFNIFRAGGIWNGGGAFSNAVAILDAAGNPLAKAEAGDAYMGSTGWKKVYFPASLTLVAGTRYILAIVASGDNIPSWGAVSGNSNYNINTSLPRSFKKASVLTLGSAVTFDSSVSANTAERIFMALIPPA